MPSRAWSPCPWVITARGTGSHGSMWKSPAGQYRPSGRRTTRSPSSGARTVAKLVLLPFRNAVGQVRMRHRPSVWPGLCMTRQKQGLLHSLQPTPAAAARRIFRFAMAWRGAVQNRTRVLGSWPCRECRHSRRTASTTSRRTSRRATCGPTDIALREAVRANGADGFAGDIATYATTGRRHAVPLVLRRPSRPPAAAHARPLRPRASIGSSSIRTTTR